MKEINQKLKMFKTLTSQQRQQVKIGVKDYVKKIKANFLKKLEQNKAKLTNLNLILGITGSGKSTLFNYLNGVKLINVNGRNQEGALTGQLKIGLCEVDLASKEYVSPIGHGFVSQTEIPQFHYHESTETTYVDCAGEFDNKDVLQSIVNSYLKYEIASQAKRVKLTIVVNRNDIYDNRGTCFKKVLEQVSNFIGLWNEFQDSKNISIVVSNVEPANTVLQIKATLMQMTRQIPDLGVFKRIIQNVVQQNSIAVFLRPSAKVSNLRYILENNLDMSYAQYEDPEGKPYDPNPNLCTPALITQALSRAKFMEVKEGLFLHNLQPNAQLIVNEVTQQIIEEIKKQLLRLVIQQCTFMNQPQGQKLKTAKRQIEIKIKMLEKNTSVQSIIDIFGIQQEKLVKLYMLRVDLDQFMTISNIADIKGQIMKISIQITNDLLKMLKNFDEKMLLEAQKETQQTKKKWNSDKATYERQLNELRSQRNKKKKWWSTLLEVVVPFARLFI